MGGSFSEAQYQLRVGSRSDNLLEYQEKRKECTEQSNMVQRSWH
jgi:hypothetical protein